MLEMKVKNKEKKEHRALIIDHYKIEINNNNRSSNNEQLKREQIAVHTQLSLN